MINIERAVVTHEFMSGLLSSTPYLSLEYFFADASAACGQAWHSCKLRLPAWHSRSPVRISHPGTVLPAICEYWSASSPRRPRRDGRAMMNDDEVLLMTSCYCGGSG